MRTLLISRRRDFQQPLIDALAKLEHEVTVLEDVAVAREALQSGGYPLIVLDVGGAEDEAVGLCRELRTVPCPVCTVLAVGNSDRIETFLSAGADDYLTDPSDAKQLEVRLAVAQRRLARCRQTVSDSPQGLQLSHVPLLHHTPYGVFTSTPQGRFREVNPALVAMLGYDSEDELLSVDMARDVYQDPEARGRLFRELTQRHQMAGVEVAWKRKDGSPIVVLASGRIVYDRTGAVSYVEGIVHDITEHKRADEALLKSERWFRSLIEFGATVYAVLDAEGKVLYESPNLEQVYGWKPEEVVDDSVFELVHPDDAEHARQSLCELVATPGVVKTVVVRYRHKNGSWRTLEVSGVNLLEDSAVGGVVLSSHDITERVWAEEAVQNSARQYRMLVETAQEGIGITDLDENVVFANQAFADLLGYTKEELVGLNLGQISDPEEFAKYRKETRRREKGQASRYETTLYTKTGQRRWISLSAAPMHDEQGNLMGTLGLLTDITQRKQAREKLLASEQRYRLIADNVADVIWTVEFGEPVELAQLGPDEDLKAATEELMRRWRFTYCSPSVERVLGYSVEEALQMRPEELLTPESLAALREALGGEIAGELETAEKGPTQLTLELQVHRKDGFVCWCESTSRFLHDDQDRLAGGLGVLRDITERRKAERALRKRETTLRSLFNNMPDFLVMVDRNAVIRFVNRGMPGMSAEEMIGSVGFDFVVPEHKERCRWAFEQTLATGQNHEVEALNVFGTWWACRVVPMVDQGEIRNAMIICTNVTQSKESAEAIQKEQRLLRQLLDLHERDRKLIAYEIHDGIAQQLTAALYNFEAFRQLPEHDSDQARKTLDDGLQLLAQGISETRRLIGGLRPPILDESGIVAAVDYLVCEAREHEVRNIEFTHDVPLDRLAPPLESAVFRIVQESLTNACRHSRSDRVRVKLAQQGDHVTVSIRDWGIGFDPENVEEHRFGLQGIRERVRLLGGKVTIQTAPGEGTRVEVELPLVRAAPQQAE